MPVFVKFKKTNGQTLYIRLDDIESVSPDKVWTRNRDGGVDSYYADIRDAVETFEKALEEEQKEKRNKNMNLHEQDEDEDEFEQEPEQDWYFTFGYGHPHAGCYTVIRGTRKKAEKEMYCRYGNKWSMQYPSDVWAGVVQYDLKEIEWRRK